jgi:hypothetical protein
MSLDWDITKPIEREGREAFFTQDGTNDAGEPMYRLKPVTEHLIWTTIFVGIGEITESSESEFFARVRLWEKVHGASVVLPVEGSDGEFADHFTTPADVRLHRGLKTNVFPADTRAKFLKRLTDRVLDEGVREYAQALEAEQRAYEGEDAAEKLAELRD